MKTQKCWQQLAKFTLLLFSLSLSGIKCCTTPSIRYMFMLLCQGDSWGVLVLPAPPGSASRDTRSHAHTHPKTKLKLFSFVTAVYLNIVLLWAGCSGIDLIVDHVYLGKSRCLDAFTIALNQAIIECEGGVKHWYASTLELQLASIEMCHACRKVPTLRVRVGDQTPSTLWSPRHSQKNLSNTHSSKVGLSSRVPGVHTFCLTWEFPEEIPAEVVWPASLQQLSFGEYFNQPIAGVVWPASLQQLSFGKSFNQPIAGVVWPASLQQLSFGSNFNKPIAGVVWPASLQQLSFGLYFNQPIVGVVWPASLQQLSFGESVNMLGNGFNQPIVDVVWPSSLQQLSFGGTFNQPIAGVSWPTSLQQLSFGGTFNQPIAGVTWPTSLQQLSFGKSFNQPRVGVRPTTGIVRE